MLKSFASFVVVGVVVGTAPAAQAFGPREVDGQRVTGVCGTVQQAPGEKACRRISGAGPQPHRIIYVNRNGGSYTSGPSTDSTTNKMSLQNVGGGLAPGGSVPPLAVDDTGWAEIMACTVAAFQPFNVTIVETDPGAVDHIEAVVGGGTEADIGYMTGLPMGFTLLGVASADGLRPGQGCRLTERGIAFVMGASHGNMMGPGATAVFNRKYLCTTIAHEVGHVLGLEHEVEPTDFMTYETNPITKGFQNIASMCGTNVGAEQQCGCDQPLQNTRVVLDEYLGPNDSTLPTLTVTSPAAGAGVAPGFEIAVDADDNYSVEQVELSINNEFVASDVTPPFTLNAPSNVAVGSFTFEVRAIDKSSNTAAAMVTVNVEPGCAGDGDCEDDETCVNMVCLGDVGATCSSGDDCATALCAAPLGGVMTSKFCTKTCNGSDECPSGFTCSDELGGAEKCVPGGGGGGCGVGGDSRAAGLSALLTALAIVAARRRRRA